MGRPPVRRLLSSVAEQHRIGEHYDQAEQDQHVNGHLAADRAPVAVLHGCRMFTCFEHAHKPRSTLISRSVEFGVYL